MKKNILVVDDSALMRRVLCDIINSDSNFQATDVCKDGLEAYEKLKHTSYDGMILDVNMPRMDGLQLLERLQKEHIQITTIMVSTLTTKDAEVTILAMERGAVDFVAKPTNIFEAKSEQFRQELLSVMDAVLDTKRFVRKLNLGQTQQVSMAHKQSVGFAKNKLIALACSTGGPKALQDVIPYLPADLDAPMVLVQHMPAGFTKSMAERLNEISSIAVKEAEDGDILQKGHVYIAPGGRHMEVRKSSNGSHRIVLNDSPAIGGLRPCANIMYESLCDSSYDEIICVVLTGMGADGTSGILSLDKHKHLHVIAQNAQTCVVYGMPRSVVEAGVVDDVVPLREIAKTIIKSVGGI